MASVDINIDGMISDTVKRVMGEHADELAIATLALWLNTDYDTARDWIISKVSIFRGIPESEVANLIKDGG